MRILRYFSAVFGISFFLLIGFDGHAKLGESSSEIETDREIMSGVHKGIRHAGGHRVHEMTAQGSNVREFVAPNGVVFGVACDGISTYHCTELLGSYKDEYSAAAQDAPRRNGSRSRSVQTSHAIIHTWGHMRNLHFTACDPSLVPSGVSCDDVK